MTVKDLKLVLEDVPDDALVWTYESAEHRHQECYAFAVDALGSFVVIHSVRDYKAWVRRGDDVRIWEGDYDTR
jgi:hypothetical protein